jgi:hypothetical protein
MKKVLFLLLVGFAYACGGNEPPPCDPDAPNTICTIAGNGEQGYNNVEGKPALTSALYLPMDTAMSPAGELHLLDFNNYLVRAIDADGNITTVVGNGQLADAPPPGQDTIPALNAGFNHTTDLFFDDGYLYLAAWHNSRIKRVNLATNIMENYAGLGVRLKYTGDEGPARDAALDLPSAIALDPDKNIVIMDQANQVIRKIDKTTGAITRIVGKCVVEEVPCGAGILPTACPSNNKFACTANGTPDELIAECAKACTPGFGGEGLDALEIRMGQPFGQMADPAGRITYDNAGNLIFADTDNHRVRKVDAVTKVVTTIVGTGEEGYSGDDGPGTAAQVYRPVDVVAAPDGTIYFSDVYNHCIRKLNPAGIVSRVAGRCGEPIREVGTSFSGDGGDPLDAELHWPYGLHLVGNQLFVADTYNNRVRVVNLP